MNMNKISVIMPVYNAEEYLTDAIKSVLKQSFDDFEFIIINHGSTDKTLSIILSFDDNRIVLLENEGNLVDALNLGLSSSTGEYIAFMNAEDIMHVDKLKIQYALMESEPSITVCGSLVSIFSDTTVATVVKTTSGLLSHPILSLLKENVLFRSTAMLRAKFIKNNRLKYEYGISAEDYKLWFEIAKLGGVFYVDTQSLLYHRTANNLAVNLRLKRQEASVLEVKREVLDFLISLNKDNYSSLSNILEGMLCSAEENLLHCNDIFIFCYVLFMKNNNNIVIC